MREPGTAARASQRGPLPRSLTAEVIGRRAELHVLAEAARIRRPVLILGPPGVSKTTMLRALANHLTSHADAADRFTWVTGDEQLTAHALVGTFDPALVLRGGYRPEHFEPGPLVRAMRAGGVLYIEEVNRAPSGALNALLTALSEGYVEVAHLGEVRAEPGFLVVAAANPRDDAGTTRLSRGLLDRFLVLEVDYQPREEEIEIVRRCADAPDAVRASDLPALAVDVIRRTRDHPDLKQGASVRAAIDMVGVLAGAPGADRELLRTLVCASVVGRIRLRASATRRPCEIVMEIFDGVLDDSYGGDLGEVMVQAASGDQVDAAEDGPVEPVLSEVGDSPAGTGGDSDEQAHRRDELPGLERPGGSGESGRSRSVPMVSRDRPMPGSQHDDEAREPAGEPLARYAQVVNAASELVLKVRGELAERLHGGDGRTLRATSWLPGAAGELDLTGTLDGYVRTGGRPAREDITVLSRAPEQADYVILVDHSGSMVGEKLVLAAVLAGVLADLSTAGRARYAVIAFDDRLDVLKPLDEQRDVEEVIEAILHLPEGKATDLSAALRSAIDLGDELPASAEAILISDCMPTKGTTSFAGLAALARRVPSLHICYVQESEPAIQMFGSGPQLNLYEWWARRWVGDERVHPMRDTDHAKRLIDALSTDNTPE